MSTEQSPKLIESTRYRDLKGFPRLIVIVFGGAAIFLAIVFVFNISFRGIIIPEIAYLYLLLAFVVPLAFLCLPTVKGATQALPWYDVLFFVLAFSISVWFTVKAEDVMHKAWLFAPPIAMGVASWVLCFLIIEALRRSSGSAIAVIATFFFCSFI